MRRAAWAIPVRELLPDGRLDSIVRLDVAVAVGSMATVAVWRGTKVACAGSRATVRATLRWRLAWFLTLAGCAGIAMHLLTFCYGYYLPPYLIASLMGVCLAMLDVSARRLECARDRQRAAQLAGIGFAVAATLLTLRYVRTAEATGREANLSRPRPWPRR